MADSSDYRLGSIWIVNFNPTVGTEIRKTRPALIVSGSLFNAKRTKVTLLPFTSAAGAIEKAPRLQAAVVSVPASEQNGLSADSLLVCIDPVTFDSKRLVKFIGFLEEDLLLRAQQILRRYLSL